MLMKLFERISEILMLPDEMVAQVNKGISVLDLNMFNYRFSLLQNLLY